MNGMTTLPAEVVLADVHHPQAPHVPKSLPSAEEPKPLVVPNSCLR